MWSVQQHGRPIYRAQQTQFGSGTHVPIVESQGGVRGAEFVVKLLGDAHGAAKGELGVGLAQSRINLRPSQKLESGWPSTRSLGDRGVRSVSGYVSSNLPPTCPSRES